MREELVGERTLAPHFLARRFADRQRHAHLGEEVDRGGDELGERVVELRVGHLAQLRRRRHAGALEALPEPLQPVGDAERVATQLFEILALDLERPFFGRALQAREDLEVLPHAVAGKDRLRDLDGELDVVAPIGLRRDLHRRRPLDAREIVHAQPQPHVLDASRQIIDRMGGPT